MLQVHIAGLCRGKLAMSEWSVLYWKKLFRSVLGAKNQAKNSNSSAGQSLHNLLLHCKTFLSHNYARGVIHATQSSLSLIPAWVVC